MRLFIAILLSEEMREALCQIQDEFWDNGVRGNYTKEENLHLTLAFIGEYPNAEEVLEVIRSVSMKPFELRLSGIGAFGDLWWVGMERSEPLAAYVKALRHALSDAGIPFDRKRFSPHITLLRRAVCDARGMPGVAVPPASMTAGRAALMHSRRGKNGMIYTEIS